MLYSDRIDVSEVTDINKTCASKEYDICHNWYFFDRGFTLQPGFCNGFHYVLMMSMNLSDIAVLRINGADYCRIISGISKALNLMRNIDSSEKSGTL